MTVQTETTTRPLTTTVDKPKPISIRRAPAEMVVGIDVGTTKVCSIAGLRKDDGSLHILAHSAVPCNGLSKGNVSDIDATADAIRKSVHSLQEAIGFKIERSQVALPRPIKTLGLHPVRVSLHPEVHIEVIANVARSEAEAGRQAAGEDPLAEAEDVFDADVDAGDSATPVEAEAEDEAEAQDTATETATAESKDGQ